MRLLPLVLFLTTTFTQVSATRRRKEPLTQPNSQSCGGIQPLTEEQAYFAGKELGKAALDLASAFMSAQPDAIREKCNETPELCDDNVFPVDVVLNRLDAFRKTNVSGISFLDVVQAGGVLPDDLRDDIRAHKRLRDVRKQFGYTERKLNKQEKTILKVSKYLAKLANEKARDKVVPVPGEEKLIVEDFDAEDVQGWRSAFSSNSNENDFETLNIDDLPVGSDFGVEPVDDDETAVVLRKRSLEDERERVDREEAQEALEQQQQQQQHPSLSRPSTMGLSYEPKSSSVLKKFFKGILRVLSFAVGVVVFVIGWLLTVLAFVVGTAFIFIAGVIGIPIGILASAMSCGLQCVECCMAPITCCCGLTCELTKASQAYKHTCDCCFMPRKMARCTALACAAPMVYAATSLADFGLYLMGSGGENYRIAARRLESRFR